MIGGTIEMNELPYDESLAGTGTLLPALVNWHEIRH
jgi:hypothetical protein